jgi:alkanesulfonate monooxygenase SsuD/methylene tetrahydromethanopterin reductase-like flavin-dependent oxidoreductase (luciferase family)
MRIGLDLRHLADGERRARLAEEADRLGLWAVLVGGSPGTETLEAATLATRTEHVHLAVWLDAGATHPLALAEEIAVLDHLSRRRALAVVDGPADAVERMKRLLAGHLVDGVALTPPPAQTRVPVWAAVEADRVELSGDLAADRQTIDERRDQDCTHLFVAWPGPLLTLARHLVTRAVGPGFPQIVADLADTVEPVPPGSPSPAPGT